MKRLLLFYCKGELNAELDLFVVSFLLYITHSHFFLFNIKVHNQLPADMTTNEKILKLLQDADQIREGYFYFSIFSFGIYNECCIYKTEYLVSSSSRMSKTKSARNVST